MTGPAVTGPAVTGPAGTDPAATGPTPAAGRGAVALRTRPKDPGQAVRTGEGPASGARAGRSTRSGRRPRAGRRRKRLTMIAGAAVLVLGAGTVGVLVLKPHGGGPAHVVVVQPKLGDFTRKPELEQQLNANQIRQQIIAKSSGQAGNVVSAVYENDASAASGSTSPQILLFIGGNLSGVSPDGFVAGFSGQFKGAQTVSAGSMGGAASCVAAKTAGEVSLCAWADNDTFGVVASPTMSVEQLSAQMRTIRPLVERPAPHKPA